MHTSFVNSPIPGSSVLEDVNAAGITEHDFQTIRKMIYDEAGISLSDAKRTLVCSRLSKRLRKLRLGTYAEYLKYLATRDPHGLERQIMINCLTTNKTDFFREPHHFNFLREQVFPQIEKAALNGGPRQLRIWSAACSTGEEPYTIAMTILEHFHTLRGWDVEIVASDINTEVLNKAKEGVYALDRIEGVDLALKRKYFLRGKGRMEGNCQVVPQLRELVSFRQLNFMDNHWPIEGSFDVVFCRNVLIYFNNETQQKLLPRLTAKINSGGYLMLGHSENLPWLAETLTPLGQTIHHKPQQAGRVHDVGVSRNVRSALSHQPNTLRSRSELSGHRGKSASNLIAARGFKLHRSSQVKPAMPKKEITAGEVYASGEEIEIATTLGSCVAACLFDPVAKVGGMNHFMLPANTTDTWVCGRYGVHAMELLINEIAKAGGDRRRLRAKVFGGSSIFFLSGLAAMVGKKNSEFIRKFLADEKIPCDAERLEGDAPLRVHFLPSTGIVYAKEIPRLSEISDAEKRFSQQFDEQIARGSQGHIELF